MAGAATTFEATGWDDGPRAWLRALRPGWPVLAVIALCPVVAQLASSDLDGATARTLDLVAAQQALGLLVEPGLAEAAARSSTLLTTLGVLYVWVHLPATVAALGWVALQRPEAFPRVRDTFVVTQLGCLAGYLALPTAPPRLLEQHGFSDTLSVVFGSQAAGSAAWLQAPYAALPSGHVAWALVAGGAVAWLARARWMRVAALLYAPAVALLTFATANHLWLDAAASVLVVLAAAGFAAVASRRRGDAALPLRRPG